MGSEYDENLEENTFFRQIRLNYGEILKTASENNWILCVPRIGSFGDIKLSKTDVLEHILVPDIDSQRFQNLNSSEIEKLSNTLIFKCTDISRRVRILFTEDFFVGNHKYAVWCVDELLSRNEVTKRIELVEINNFCDCINFLWTDTLGCRLLEEINTIVQLCLYQSNMEELDLLQLKDVMQDTYDQCLYKAVECFQDKLEDENFVQNLKLAVETFMYACVKEKLFNCLCTLTSSSDANLNKIIRNSQDIPLRAFKISNEFYDLLPLSKIELNKINNTYTILNKIMCLRCTFKVLSKKLLNSEVLLEIFIFLLIKSNIYNWIANLTFIATFRFCDMKPMDESNFLITTLQAAIKYLNDGNLNKLKHKIEPQICQGEFSSLVALIEEGNLNALINAVSCNHKLSKQLCHPLCSCDNCEHLLRTNTCQIDSRDELGRSLLHIAAKVNHSDIIQFLIMKGANINATDYSGLTPLHYAVSSGNQQAAFLLLHSGCEKNIRDSEGNTPLHVATRNGQEHCVKTLIYFTEDRGCDLDINCTNNSGDTALHFASKYGYINIVQLLIEYGAKIVLNSRSLSPYHVGHNDNIKNILKSVASLSRDLPTKEVIKPGKLKKDVISNKISDIIQDKKHITNFCKNDTANFGLYPKNLEQFKKTDLLLKAIENNDLPLTCFYLGIPMPATSSITRSNCHPLCICEKCQDSMEENTITNDYKSNALNINICNPEGFTPLHIASKFGRTEILRLLLDAGAVVNLKTYKTFHTPLHIACIFRKKHIVRELLKCGNCRIDPVDSYGNTPLHYACLNNDLETFEILIVRGADAKVKNNAGKTVIDEAEEHVFLNISRMLKERTDCKKLCVEDIL